MKRQELKNLLRGIKPDGDLSDTIDAIMEMNGADIENAKKNAGTDYEKIVAENERLTAQLKAYEKGGEKLDDKGKVTAEYEKKYSADFKAECPDGFAQPNDGTGAPAHGGNGSNEGGGTPPKATLESVLKEYHDSKK